MCSNFRTCKQTLREAQHFAVPSPAPSCPSEPLHVQMTFRGKFPEIFGALSKHLHARQPQGHRAFIGQHACCKNLTLPSWTFRVGPALPAETACAWTLRLLRMRTGARRAAGSRRGLPPFSPLGWLWLGHSTGLQHCQSCVAVVPVCLFIMTAQCLPEWVIGGVCHGVFLTWLLVSCGAW